LVSLNIKSSANRCSFLVTNYFNYYLKLHIDRQVIDLGAPMASDKGHLAGNLIDGNGYRLGSSLMFQLVVDGRRV
jgi:hypothetical protein